jgi:hypothetical protein
MRTHGMELEPPEPPGVITYAHGMELEPPEPPRAAVMAPRNYRAPVGALPPSPNQRDKAAPLGSRGVKPPYQAGNYRGLEAPGKLARRGGKPTLRDCQRRWQSLPPGGLATDCRDWQSSKLLLTKVLL